MKIFFKRLDTTAENIDISLDDGTSWNAYKVSRLQNEGLPLSATQDFSKIRIRGKSTLLTNLEVLQNIKIVDNLSMDTIYPIGCTYTQYPQTKSPNDLFPFTKWELVDFDGAFFRAEGTNANEFIENGDIKYQDDAMQKITGTVGGFLSIGPINTHSGAFKENKNNWPFAFLPGTGSLGAAQYTTTFDSSEVVRTADETRPKNLTIRIWKRVE